MKIEPGYYYLSKGGQIFGPIKRDTAQEDETYYCPHTQQGFYPDGKAWGRLKDESDLDKKILQIKVDGSAHG